MEIAKEIDSEEADDAFNMTVESLTNNYFENPYDSNYYALIDSYTEANLATSWPAWEAYFTAKCAYLKYKNPTWTKLRVYFEASKEMLHIALDIVGLVPVVGEVADLTNGIIYAIEGDGVNATLSVAAMIPVAGIGATSVKYARKTINITSTTKTTLNWGKNTQNLWTFGDRKQLRKVLNLATGDTRQAHHIIPWGKSTHPAIQKAAGSGYEFHMNAALNGIPLNTAVHNGSHANYDNLVQARLNNIPINATPEEAYDEILDIIQDIRTAIQNNPGVPINQLTF